MTLKNPQEPTGHWAWLGGVLAPPQPSQAKPSRKPKNLVGGGSYEVLFVNG